jgi:hypothetical protein
VSVLRAAARSSVPVDPDAETARQWATEELSRRIYGEQEGLLDRLIEWLVDQLDRLSELGSSGGGWVLPVAAVVVTAVVVTVGLLVGPPARRRRADRRVVGVLDDERRTAAELRASADHAAARGDFAGAVLDRFRAIIRSLAERTLLDDRPGLTADEAGREAGDRFPALARELSAAARLFDRVRYGQGSAGPDDDARLRDLDERVRQTRVERPAVAAAEMRP